MKPSHHAPRFPDAVPALAELISYFSTTSQEAKKIGNDRGLVQSEDLQRHLYPRPQSLTVRHLGGFTTHWASHIPHLY